MSIPSAFLDAVKQKDSRSVRIMMKDSLLFESNFEPFEEMRKYAEKLQSLYDIHDGEDLLKDPSKWDNAYMDGQMAKVIRNFSKERLDHLKKVVQHLRPAPAAVDPLSDNGKPRREVRCNVILTGAAPGLLAVGISTLFGESLATSIAIGAVTGCGAAYICRRKERDHG